MKRSPLLRRTPLKQGNALARSKALTRAARAEPLDTTSKAVSAGARPSSARVNVPASWTSDVFRMHGYTCIITGQPAEHAHHIITAQVLRRELPPEAQTAALGDPRNGMPIARWPHDNHHHGIKRIPRTALPASAIEFAKDLDTAHGTRLEAWLDRTYPEGTR